MVADRFGSDRRGRASPRDVRDGRQEHRDARRAIARRGSREQGRRDPHVYAGDGVMIMINHILLMLMKQQHFPNLRRFLPVQLIY